VVMLKAKMKISFFVGTIPVPYHKDKCGPAARQHKRYLVRQGAKIFKKENYSLASRLSRDCARRSGIWRSAYPGAGVPGAHTNPCAMGVGLGEQSQLVFLIRDRPATEATFHGQPATSERSRRVGCCSIYWLAASRTGIICKKVKRHGEVPL
jgi:hypothetical protein